jgi:DNA-binding transcriptional regulator YhcF (GntR family)
MLIKSFGPRTQRVYAALRDRIVRGELPAGAKLPPHINLAADYGVAPLTMRQVLARLEAEGLVSREHGRGTFVRAQALPAVLIVEDDPAMRVLLAEYVTRAGHRPIPVTTAVEGLGCLSQDTSIALVFSDVRLPDTATGIGFIQAVRRRWPELPLVALTGYPDDLTGLHGTPECPVLILTKPFWAHQIEDTLRLALRA